MKYSVFIESSLPIGDTLSDDWMFSDETVVADDFHTGVSAVVVNTLELNVTVVDVVSGYNMLATPCAWNVHVS